MKLKEITGISEERNWPYFTRNFLSVQWVTRDVFMHFATVDETFGLTTTYRRPNNSRSSGLFRTNRLRRNRKPFHHQMVSHLTYSQDLVPSDFILFPNLKKSIARKRFASNEEALVSPCFTSQTFTDIIGNILKISIYLYTYFS